MTQQSRLSNEIGARRRVKRRYYNFFIGRNDMNQLQEMGGMVVRNSTEGEYLDVYEDDLDNAMALSITVSVGEGAGCCCCCCCF